MKITQLLLLLMLSMLMVACGQKSMNGKKTIALNKEEINKMLAKQTVECESLDGKDCPVGIARVFILNPKNPQESSVCTGFLNGTNRLVTNNHCVSSLSECETTYISVYTEQGHSSARCKSIIKTENDGRPLNQKAIDYTVMELDKKIETRTFPLSAVAPLVGEKVTAWVVDHLTQNNARITELDCTLQGRRNSLELQNCPAIQGNSGSPIVNESGEIVAVLWGSTVGDTVNEQTPLPERRSLTDYALGTELKHFKNSLVK